MTIQIIKQSAGIQDLRDSGAVARPLSEPACTTRTLALSGADPHKAGVWECTAGRYERQVAEGEVMHILAGRCTFTPTGGQPLRIEAGDTVFFPPKTTGVWHIEEAMRKVYVVLAG